MKTWRERVVEAKERGYFTQQDVDDAEVGRTCLVGEAAAKFGRHYYQMVDLFVIPDLGNVHRWVGGAFPAAVRNNDFATAEMLVDAVEDRTLELKRTWKEM